MTNRFKIMTVIAGFALMTALGAGVRAEAAELVHTYGAWKTYRHGSGEQRMCFAVTEAGGASADGGQRQKPHVFVTTWPTAGIKGEISVLIGAALKKGAQIKVDVDGRDFELFPDGDRAYVGDADDEAKLLDAMRRGRSMTVTATTSSGQQTRDSYSLSGVTAAVQSIASGCS